MAECEKCGYILEATCECCECRCPRPDLTPEKIIALQATVPENEPNRNPKDIAARRKVSISKLPVVALIHGGMAMMDGARKYGPYNWRAKEVYATVYIDAALRHLACYLEGEEFASDSGVHHLGHVIGCCAILLDAQACGKLVDDRPKGGPSISSILQGLSDVLTQARPVVERVDPYQGTDK